MYPDRLLRLVFETSDSDESPYAKQFLNDTPYFASSEAALYLASKKDPAAVPVAMRKLNERSGDGECLLVAWTLFRREIPSERWKYLWADGSPWAYEEELAALNREVLDWWDKQPK